MSGDRKKQPVEIDGPPLSERLRSALWELDNPEPDDAYLMEHAGEVVTRTMLLEQVWEFHFEPKTSVVETHVSRLRGKIDKPFDTELIRTVRGAGYVISAPQ